MATGNDGQLLQQCCELAAMHALVRATKSQRFHLFCTHAMAPEAACEIEVGVHGRDQLSRVLNLADAQNKPLPVGTKLRSSPLIDVLAALHASPERYPNSARVLAQRAGCLNVSLTGVLVESDASAEAALREAFPPPAFRVFGGDWRNPLARYRSYGAPWLFTLAPGAFSRRTAAKAGAELRAVGRHVDRVLVPAGHPGVVCVFYDAMDELSRAAFWEAAVDAFGQHDTEFIAAVARAKGKLHVGALMSTVPGVVSSMLDEVRASLETVDPV